MSDKEKGKNGEKQDEKEKEQEQQKALQSMTNAPLVWQWLFINKENKYVGFCQFGGSFLLGMFTKVFFIKEKKNREW